ncbi:MAG: DMT family transporter, partial [Ornithinimicrobium sp.]
MTKATAPSMGTTTPSGEPGRWVPQFLSLAVFWGCSFAFIGISLESLTPVQVAFWRLFLGAVTLAVIVVVTRTRLPDDLRTWAHLAVVAAFLNAVPFTLFAIGQQHVSSVLAAIINAATPLVTLLVVIAAFPEEKPTWFRGLGLATGFAGILVVLGVWRTLPEGELRGVVACLAAIACYGIAFPYSRRYLRDTGVRPAGLAAGQVGMATMMLLPVVLITGVKPTSPLTGRVIIAMLALGAFSSGIAYILNFHVVAQAGATTASSVTYLTPV